MTKEERGATQENPRAPERATQPFKGFMDQVERLNELLHLSMRGISMLGGVPRLVEVLAKVGESRTGPPALNRSVGLRHEVA